MTEQWLPVPGFAGLYEVSDQGRVKSLHRSKEHILSPATDTPGYLAVHLYQDGRGHTRLVHRLVCLAFHGEPEAGQQVAHLDGDKTNAAAANLTWATCSENNRHKERHGTRQIGKRNGRAKFDATMAENVRKFHRQGYSEVRIAEATGVSKSHVHRILSGAVWAE